MSKRKSKSMRKSTKKYKIGLSKQRKATKVTKGQMKKAAGSPPWL